LNPGIPNATPRALPSGTGSNLEPVPAGRTRGGALDMCKFKTHGICPRRVNGVVMLGCYDFRNLTLAAGGTGLILTR
jgi:hypothetical protein